jgi:REP-associated tyrosine transposase
VCETLIYKEAHMPSSRSAHRPVHFYVEGGCYFITAAILEHQPLMLAPERREWFVTYLSEGVNELHGELVAWVVLPNHYYTVVRVKDERTASLLAQRVHARSALRFNREDDTPGRQVWFSYWDRCLWTEGDFWSRINYIHRNPVRHGYVAAPEDWEHSSWRQFARVDRDSEAGLGLLRFPAPRQLPHDP